MLYQHVFNAQLPMMPKSGLFSRRFDFSQIFNANIIKELKYTIVNHNKKIQADYQFDQPSSVRVYSDSADNIELSLVSGIYLNPVDDNFDEHEAELLDEEEIEGCGCSEEIDSSEHSHEIKQTAWED